MSLAATAALAVLAFSGCDADPSIGLSANRGSSIYLKNCASCHGSDGSSPLAMVPPLIGSEWVVGRPMPLVAILLDGLRSPGTAGDENYRGVMPAWRDVLKDEQIADVLNFLRVQSGVGVEVSPELVSGLREKAEHRHAFWTPAELREAAVLIGRDETD